MIYDAREEFRRTFGAVAFPCPVRFIDPANGERIPNVFWADTAGKLMRFISFPDGTPLLDRRGERLEIHEVREWLATTLDGKTIVAQSETKCTQNQPITS